MRKTFYFFLSLIVISCSSETDKEVIVIPEEVDSIVTEGKQAFRIDFKEITANKLSNKNFKSLVPAFVLISINDDDGNVIRTREKIAIHLVTEKYITDEITLDTGVYNVTEFIVTDADNVVISLVPMTNSVLSQFTENPLPFSFTVESNESNVTSTDNIDAEGYTAVDFGYGELNLIIPITTDFFSLTIDDSTLITTKVIVLKSLTASSYFIDWGDGTIDEYISTKSGTLEENELTHTYSEENVYTVNISGPLEVIEYFKFYGSGEGNSYRKSNIISVDIDKLILLKTCDIYSGELSTLDTSKNTLIETLSLGYNQITSLDFTNNPELKTAWLRYNQLTDLDVSENLNLEFLWLTGNQISNLDISNNTKLEKVFVRENELTSFNVSNNLALNWLDLSNNFLTSIDVSNNTNLKEINVGANELTGIDLSKNTNLNRIDLYLNQITDIDLSYNVKLINLYINGNLLNEIDLSHNIELERLIIEDNNFSSLDITHNPKIFDLEIGENQFSGTQLDALITLVYDQAILNSTTKGHIDFKNNPGFDEIDITTTAKINELTDTYMWVFN